jgi:hypothetical protein
MEISKCFFGIFNSPKKKKMKKKWLYYYGTSSRTVFVHFLGELKTPKRHIKINWPLVKGLSFSSWVVWSYSWNINVFSFSIAAASHRLLIGFLLWWIRLRIGLGCNVAILACSLRPKKNLPMTLYFIVFEWK